MRGERRSGQALPILCSSFDEPGEVQLVDSSAGDDYM